MAEFKQFTEQQPAFKVLKPWWDVLAEYLTVAMLMIGVFGCTLQVRGGAMKGRALHLRKSRSLPVIQEGGEETESRAHLHTNFDPLPPHHHHHHGHHQHTTFPLFFIFLAM